jgi:hypothetical protein
MARASAERSGAARQRAGPPHGACRPRSVAGLAVRVVDPELAYPLSMTRVLLAALVSLVGCTPPAVATERALVPALGCSLDVPVGTRIELADDGATFTVRPGTRTPRSFAVHARAPTQPGELRRALAPDVSVAYTLRASDGGSGGVESVLTGGLRVGGSEFAVRCVDQAEPPVDADATWCLAWLATIRLDR